MCTVRKHPSLSFPAIIAAGLTLVAGAAHAQSAGGVSIGDGAGGITDRVYVSAPPNYTYVVETERGSFLDCGESRDTRSTDRDGRDEAFLRCGVTLTETIVIPAAAQSARITIHY